MANDETTTINADELEALRGCAKTLRGLMLAMTFAERAAGGDMAVAAAAVEKVARLALDELDRSRGHAQATPNTTQPPDRDEGARLLDACLPGMWCAVQNTLVEKGLVLNERTAITVSIGAIYMGFVIAHHHKVPMDLFQTAAVSALASALSGQMDGVLPGTRRGIG